MKILITGICGFVGSTIATSLLCKKDEITIIGMDNFIRPGSEENRQKLQRLGIKLYHGDIRSHSDFESLPAVDWVIDVSANPSVLAGIDGKTSSRQLIEHNLLGTVNILEYCKRHSAGFVLVSTSRVYSILPLAGLPVEQVGDAFRLKVDGTLPVGVSQNGISENFSCVPPLSLYGSTKFASELLALEYGETFGFPVWINRCGVLAGAGQFGRPDQGIFAYWINAWIKRHPLAYIGFGGRGCQVRDCLHPRDLVPLIIKQIATGSTASVRTINVGGGMLNAMSLAELSDWCSDRFGRHEVSSDPASRPFDIPWVVMDSALAHQIWDWQPQTSLNDILSEIALHAEKHPEWLETSGIR